MGTITGNPVCNLNEFSVKAVTSVLPQILTLDDVQVDLLGSEAKQPLTARMESTMREIRQETVLEEDEEALLRSPSASSGPALAELCAEAELNELRRAAALEDHDAEVYSAILQLRERWRLAQESRDDRDALQGLFQRAAAAA